MLRPTLRPTSTALVGLGLAAALAATACTTETVTPSPGDLSPTDAPSTPGDPTDAGEDEAAAGLRALGEPMELGVGTIAGVAPDGEHLLVLAPDPESDRIGCEGVPFELPWTVDVESGERRRATDLPTDDVPFVTNILLGTDGLAVLVGACEGFLGDVHVATMADDGTLDDLRKLDLPPGELRSWTIHLFPDGRDLAVTGSSEFDNPGVFVVDTDTGEWTAIDNRPLQEWIPLPGGGAVEVGTNQQITVVDPSGTETSTFPGDVFVASSDGLPGLVFAYGGGEGTTSLVLPGGARQLLADEEGFAGSFSPALDLVAFSTNDAETFETSITLHEIATGEEATIPDAWFAGVYWTTSGVAYVAEGPEDDLGFGEPIVRHRAWID